MKRMQSQLLFLVTLSSICQIFGEGCKRKAMDPVKNEVGPSDQELEEKSSPDPGGDSLPAQIDESPSREGLNLPRTSWSPFESYFSGEIPEITPICRGKVKGTKDYHPGTFTPGLLGSSQLLTGECQVVVGGTIHSLENRTLSQVEVLIVYQGTLQDVYELTPGAMDEKSKKLLIPSEALIGGYDSKAKSNLYPCQFTTKENEVIYGKVDHFAEKGCVGVQPTTHQALLSKEFSLLIRKVVEP